ncbi:unnamed protein product [Clonostachys byssicola]|uniref:Sphingoid long-chain base transporter RSB1 n=1 Tax=Clonostachys byssicola TaxID=160290 RepID=A0A9N9U274_9HYPO|nr:unnamed protein product [Clonostachys byssicola]
MSRPLYHNPIDDQYYLPFGKKANCTLDVCPIETTIYKYNPDKAVNMAFTVIFALIMFGHIYLGIRWKTWGYMTSMILGCLLEIAGYACRVVLHANPFKFLPFVVQTVALTIAPIFYTAGIYVTLSASISHFAPDLTRVKPSVWVWIFLPADILCLVLQGAGGALSVTATSSDTGKIGNKVSQAGLSLQLVVLVGFMAAFADFFIRFFMSHRLPKVEWRLKAFVAGIGFSVTIILARCAFRVYELKEGYSGTAITHEVPFIIAEGVFMILGAAALFWGHPGLAIKPDYIQYPAKSTGSDSDDSSYPTIGKGTYPPMSQPAYHASTYPPVQTERTTYQPPAHYSVPVQQQAPAYPPARNSDRPSYPPVNDRPSYPPAQHTRPAYNNHTGQRPVISKPQMQYRPAHV